MIHGFFKEKKSRVVLTIFFFIFFVLFKILIRLKTVPGCATSVMAMGSIKFFKTKFWTEKILTLEKKMISDMNKFLNKKLLN